MDEIEKRKLNLLNSDLESLKQVSILLENMLKIDEKLVPSQSTNKLDVDFDYQNTTEFLANLSEEIKKLQEDILTEKLAILSKQKRNIPAPDLIERIENNDEVDHHNDNIRCTDNPCPIKHIKMKIIDYQKLPNISPVEIEKLAKCINEIDKFQQQINADTEIADNLSVFSDQFEKIKITRKEKVRNWCCCCFSCCRKNNDQGYIDNNESERLA